MATPVSMVRFLNYEEWEWGKIVAADIGVMASVALFQPLSKNIGLRCLRKELSKDDEYFSNFQMFPWLDGD